MDSLEFTSSIISSIIWPLALLVIALVFRGSLIELVRSVTKLRLKDLEIEFDRLSQAASRLGEIEQTPTEPKPPTFVAIEDQLHDLARSAPAAAVLLAWTLVESSMSRCVARLSVSPEPPSLRSALHNLEQLRVHAGLSEATYQAINELRGLRNRIAHDPGAQRTVPTSDAQLYVQTVERAVAVLEGLPPSPTAS